MSYRQPVFRKSDKVPPREFRFSITRNNVYYHSTSHLDCCAGLDCDCDLQYEFYTRTKPDGSPATIPDFMFDVKPGTSGYHYNNDGNLTSIDNNVNIETVSTLSAQSNFCTLDFTNFENK